jgi:hypothetical protein
MVNTILMIKRTKILYIYYKVINRYYQYSINSYTAT